MRYTSARITSSPKMSLYMYIDTPNSNLVCCICQTPFTEPTTTLTCAHTFCRECILRALHHAPLCPVDRSPLSEGDLSPADPIIRSLVEELQVECVHSGSSTGSNLSSEVKVKCRWTGQRQWLASHLRDGCVYGQVECEEEGCKVVVERRELGRHREEMHGTCSVDANEDLRGKNEEITESSPSTSNSDPAQASSATPPDHPLLTHQQRQQERQQKTIELLMEQNMLLKHRVDVLEGTVASMKKEMGAVKSALGPWFRCGTTPIATAGSTMRLQSRQRAREGGDLQSQTPAYQTRGGLGRVSPGEGVLRRGEEVRGSEIALGEQSSGDNQRSLEEAPLAAAGTTSPRTSPAARSGGSGAYSTTIIHDAGVQPTPAAISALSSVSSGSSPSSANASSVQAQSGGFNAPATMTQMYTTATHGHGHRASLSLPGDAHGPVLNAGAIGSGSDGGGVGGGRDPLAGHFPTLEEFGIGPPLHYHHAGNGGGAFMHQQPGIHNSGILPGVQHQHQHQHQHLGIGIANGGIPGGLQMNPRTVTRVAPLDLGTNLHGTLEGLRESVVGVAAGIDELGRRSEIALANETLRLGEEVVSMRAGVHGLRMQIHAMMMERNMQVTGAPGAGAGAGAGREEGMGVAGPWMGFAPRMYNYGGPPNITKL